MELADEIRKLKELRDNGTLTDAEFAQAKAALLAGSKPGRERPAPGGQAPDNTLGAAANRWVKFQIVVAIVGFVLALIFYFGFFRPNWKKSRSDFDRRWNEFPGTEQPGTAR